MRDEVYLILIVGIIMVLLAAAMGSSTDIPNTVAVECYSHYPELLDKKAGLLTEKDSVCLKQYKDNPKIYEDKLIKKGE